MERTVSINIDEDLIKDVPLQEVQKAVGRLSLWASFPSVSIYNDGKNDLVAHYFREDEQHGYTIGAIWRGNEFTFHS